jgi:predicted metal-dependent phosphoesterase TrpH
VASRPGWVRADCHLHTIASGDAWTTLDQLAERVVEVGLDVVFITDHNVTSAAVTAMERGIGARVIVGEEVRTPSGDIIGLFLTERIPYVLPLAEVTGRIRAQGGLVYAPHPFDPERAGIRPQVLESLVEAQMLDIVEVFNAKLANYAYNLAAVEFAEHFDLPPGVGSDAHDPHGVGAAYIEVPDFDGPTEMLAALRRGRVVGEYRPHAPRYPTRQSVAPAVRDGRPYPQERADSTLRA